MTIIRRGSSFAVRIYVGRGKYDWIGTRPTRAEAEELEFEAKRNSVRGSKETVAQFARRWPDDYPRPKFSTTDKYRANVSTLLNDEEPVAGTNRPLKDLKMRDVTRPIARAYATKHRWLHSTLRAMFTDAVQDGIASINPFANLRMTGSKGRRHIEALTEQEVYQLAQCAEPLKADMVELIMFAAYTGIRPGELYALLWGDVDLEKGTVWVRRRLYKDNIDTPKNGKTRQVILPGPAAGALSVLEEKRPTHAYGDPLFLTSEGVMFGQTKLAYYWHPTRAAFEAQLPEERRLQLAEARGKPHMDFYELRHVCATLLLERGCTPEDVAVHLGHTDGGRLVRELYGHPSEDRARERLRMAFGTETQEEARFSL